MKAIDPNSLVDLVFHMDWHCPRARHSECYQASQVNIWRDFFPRRLYDSLIDKQAGDRIELTFKPGELLQAFDSRLAFGIHREQFDCRHTAQPGIEPRFGRFYPKGLLKGVAGVFKANIEPFRCIGIENGNIRVNFNHPLSDRRLDLSVTVGRVSDKSVEHGGSSMDWIGELSRGPGMQMRWQDGATDYFSDQPFTRADPGPDTRFYARPRLTRHLDDMATDVVRSVYARFLTDDMRVLDLMSSCHSNVPRGLTFRRFAGLGLNADEMRANRHVSDYTIHDLNADPVLPYEAESFDAVLCSVSVEYLTEPFAIFQEVGRILRPGGYLVVAFSDRWFPPKVTRIWTELHEFERVGLVLEYFIRTGRFEKLHSYSVRGLPRPRDDKYFPQMRLADPVFAVWGQRR